MLLLSRDCAFSSCYDEFRVIRVLLMQVLLYFKFEISLIKQWDHDCLHSNNGFIFFNSKNFYVSYNDRFYYWGPSNSAWPPWNSQEIEGQTCFVDWAVDIYLYESSLHDYLHASLHVCLRSLLQECTITEHSFNTFGYLNLFFFLN